MLQPSPCPAGRLHQHAPGQPYILTLHPTPCNLISLPDILHPTPYALHSTPSTLYHTPYTIHPTPLPTCTRFRASASERGEKTCKFSRKLPARQGQNEAFTFVCVPYSFDYGSRTVHARPFVGHLFVFLKPSCRSWSHFLGLHYQKLTRSLEN